MKLPNDVICGVCKKVFCCAECRYKHEIKTHAIVVHNPKNNQTNPNLKTSKLAEPWKESETGNLYVFCPLCERKPMPLQRDMYTELLAHVEQYHLPLHCRKCTKVYNRIDELKSFSKCTHTPIPLCSHPGENCCNLLDQTYNTLTVKKDLAKVTISTQTSPQRRPNGEFHETPISLINLRWKAKSKLTHEEFVSDSISSLKNISSINNSSTRRSLEAIVRPKGQLVRTTSTPVHAEMLCTKHTERTFNASGGQVSSIYHSGAESDNPSPAVTAGAPVKVNVGGVSPSKQHLESINRHLKVGGPRSKMSTVTPLRQVMSKSIQKAFAEHGGLPSARLGDADWPSLRKQISQNSETTNSSNGSVGSPLDLRLSPVVRRSHSEVSTNQFQTNDASDERISGISNNLRLEVLRSSQKLTTTESIVIMRTKHMTSVESTASSVSDELSSNASMSNYKTTGSSSSTTTNNSSGVSSSSSSASASSIYKTCESIEIFAATTALNEIQQDYYAFGDKIDGSIEKIIPTIENAAQVISSNLQPLTPITRIPGAVINKKLIRFDSPCEEEELENPADIETHTNKENEAIVGKINPPKKPALSYASPVHNRSTTGAGLCGVGKVTETPRCADSSVAEAFFTPNATPIRRNKKPLMMENVHKLDDFVKDIPPRPPSLRKCKRSAAFDHSKSESDETPPNADSGKEVVQHTESTLCRSWSFGALLGSVMRLNSKGKCAAIEKIEAPPRVEPDSDSFIKRCASIAGSLIRSQSLIDEKEQITQKRKRSYTIDTKSASSPHYHRNYNDPLSPNSENCLGTKRFRIHGRKPIDRMLRET